jgi:CubicO group peptidase (beta-lactamase class C family)
MAKSFLILLSLISSICLSQKSLQTASPESVGVSSDRLLRLDEQMHKFVDEGQLSAVHSAIIRKGKLIHWNIYGHEDIESDDKLKDNSIWRIYSMTKPIVSVAAMMLYEQGHFQLNDPLFKYIPEMKNLMVHVGNGELEQAKNPIKIVDLFRHTSGIGYGWSGGYVDSLYASVDRKSMNTNEGLVKGLCKLPLYSEPGNHWRYGLSTDVLGYFVEVLSGQPLDEYLKDHIFSPLGMNDTHFEIPDNKDHRFVSNYTTDKETGRLKVIDAPSFSPYCKEVTFFSGGGGLASTAEDYLRFCQMLLNGGQLEGKRILRPKTIELMIQDHSSHTSHHGGPVVMPTAGSGFGLGFAITKNLAYSGNTGSLGAYGWGGAAGTYFSIDPEEDLILLLMIQLMPYNHLQAREKFHTMVYQSIID